jgi:uncharacterized protein (DUF1330 family)
MSYFLVAQIEFHNEDWWRDYLKNVTPLVHRHGGKILARTKNYERVAGETGATICAIVEWPDKQAFYDFRDDPDFEPWKRNRLAGSTGNAVLISGEDDMAKVLAGSSS